MASVIKAEAQLKVALTIRGANIFGRICLQMIIGERVPDATAASTNGWSRRLRTTPRISRETRGKSATLMAMITFPTEARVRAMSAMASRMDGTDIRLSITRIATASKLRRKPNIKPINVPVAAESTAAETPTIREICAPYNTLEYTSRPSMSVPNQNSAEGARPRLIASMAVGSTVPSQGANTARSTIISSSVPPATIAGLRRMKC